MTTALVVPAHREAASIAEVVRSLAHLGPVIVVDDASGDETADRAREAGAEVVTLEQNAGYGGAIDSGFRRALSLGVSYVVTVDGDGQHDPGDVAETVRLLEEGDFNLVIGIRPARHQIIERLCTLYARRSFGVEDPLCGLKGYDVRLYVEYGGFDLRHSVGTELMTYALRHGARWTQLPILIHPRSDGDSRFYASLRANLRIVRSLVALIRVR